MNDYEYEKRFSHTIYLIVNNHIPYTVIVPIREVGLSASSAENLEKNPKVGSR